MTRVVELSGGVGGARLGRGLDALPDVDLVVVVNVGDDLPLHGLYVSPDLDTMVYTLAGVEGPHGWGRADDTFRANTELARFGVDNGFQLGDLDLALKIYRSHRIAQGDKLTEVTDSIRAGFGIRSKVLPASDEPVRTMVTTTDGSRLNFREYFVDRGHRDHVSKLEFVGAQGAAPAPGVLEAIDGADLVVIGPSNPPLSIWPILAVEDIQQAVRRHPNVIAISPLIESRTLKGPADVVMADLGLGSGSRAVLASYDGLIDTLVVDVADNADEGVGDGVGIVALETRIADPADAAKLARAILSL
ncbi:MAG TPA: 2-phospho-L-lactate transferase [Acidimicrobiia bacterium]|nr:2-phospho-L-lactate transferase [Acidimicrobiia bacterium]